MTKISYITVAYNSASTIADCIKSVAAQSDSEHIIVDNASDDDTVNIVKKYPKVTLIEPGSNKGFNYGNSLGAKKAKGEYLVFLNPDATIPSGTSEIISKNFTEHANIGLLGPQIINRTGGIEPCGNGFVTMGSLLYEYSGYGDLFPNSRAYKKFRLRDWDRKSSRYLDVVSGAMMAVRKSDLDTVGGFDTNYFLYFEEYDLAKRILQKLNKKSYYEASIVIHHKGGVSTAQLQNEAPNNYSLESRDYYLKKFYGLPYFLLFKCLRFMFNGINLIRQILSGKRHS